MLDPKHNPLFELAARRYRLKNPLLAPAPPFLKNRRPASAVREEAELVRSAGSEVVFTPELNVDAMQILDIEEYDP